jgi:glycosyltransferase involved in cell wall biosynthesis
MRKVLIITYYWPPAGGPGSQRMVKFAKYLPNFGWQPIILTVENGEFPYLDDSLAKDISSDVKVYRTASWEPFLFYKKLTKRASGEALPVGLLADRKKSIAERIASWIRVNLFVPDARVGWKPFATKKALEIIRKEDIDLIFSSSPPHSLQIIAKRLKKRTGLPWVADFRDRWTDIRYYQVLERPRLRITRKVDSILEKKVLTSANYVTATSEGFLRNFNEKIKPKTQSFHFIPNGYDEDDFDDIAEKELQEFRILHAGSLIGQQNPQVLWNSLFRLFESDPGIKRSLRVHFIGKSHDSIVRAVHEKGLSDIVEFKDHLPHKNILVEFSKASILLAVIPDIPNNRSIVLGKIYEYIGTGKPILIIGPPEGDAAKIISEIANSAICDYADEEHCAEFIRNVFAEWAESKRVPLTPVQQRLRYSRQNIAKSLAEIFNSQQK